MSGEDFQSALNRRAVWATLACALKLRQTHTTHIAPYWKMRLFKCLDEIENQEPELLAHLDRMGHDITDDWVAEARAKQRERQGT